MSNELMLLILYFVIRINDINRMRVCVYIYIYIYILLHVYILDRSKRTLSNETLTLGR